MPSETEVIVIGAGQSGLASPAPCRNTVCGEPTAVTVVAVAMVVRVAKEPWRAREELPPIEGPRR